ncbi:MAG TPA: alpha/beta hydrolase [Acidimicrobiales bacterium]
MSATVRTLELAGTLLNYDVVGRGPPMIVLPGGPGFGYGYLKPHLSSALGSSFELWFVDQRGCGHSLVDDPATMRIEVLVDDLERFREAMGLTQPHLLGHSFGGHHALRYAAAHPARVRSLILVDSDPATAEQWARSHQVLESRRTPEERRQLTDLAAADGWHRDLTLATEYFAIFLRAYFHSRDAHARLDMSLDAEVLENLELATQTLRASLSGYDTRRLLKEITCPALVITGTASIFGVEAEAELADLIPNATLTVLEAGHFPHMEATTHFIEHVTRFTSAPD